MKPRPIRALWPLRRLSTPASPSPDTPPALWPLRLLSTPASPSRDTPPALSPCTAVAPGPWRACPSGLEDVREGQPPAFGGSASVPFWSALGSHSWLQSCWGGAAPGASRAAPLAAQASAEGVPWGRAARWPSRRGDPGRWHSVTFLSQREHPLSQVGAGTSEGCPEVPAQGSPSHIPETLSLPGQGVGVVPV